MAELFPCSGILLGPTIRLRTITAEDFDALRAATSDPLIWEQHPTTDRHTLEGFTPWFERALAEQAYVVEALGSAAVIGSSRYYDWDPAAREVAIGHTFLVRTHWGGTTNAEMKRLMLAQAFKHTDAVWFHVAVGNNRSRRAMDKIGGVWSHDGILEGLPYHYIAIKGADWAA